MSLIRMWGAKHRVSAAALLELEQLIGVAGHAAVSERPDDGSEARQQSLVRLEAAQKDVLLWRNNSGAFEDKGGQWVRYGLCNDSEKMNKQIKSADLVGLRKKLVTPNMVGSVVGIFTARECKHATWRFKGNAHELAQLRWIDLVNSYGGDAAFATGPGTL